MLNDTIGATPRRFQSPPRAKVFGPGRRKPMDSASKARLLRVARAQRISGRVSRAHFDVLYALLFVFHNAASGRCDPGYKRLAAEAGCSVSTAQLAVSALELLGLLVVVNRLQWAVVSVPGLGRQRRPRRASNCYVFVLPDAGASAAAVASRPEVVSMAISRRVTRPCGASEGASATPVALDPVSSSGGVPPPVWSVPGDPVDDLLSWELAVAPAPAAAPAPSSALEAALARLGRVLGARS